MRVGLVGRGSGGDKDFYNKGVRTEVVGKNCGVCRREAYLQAVNRRGEDGCIQ